MCMEGAFNAMRVHVNEFRTPSNRLNEDKLDITKSLEGGESFGVTCECDGRG
jgi:hypothetical protein